MDEMPFPCDVPPQYLDERGREAYRRAEAEIEAAVGRLNDATADLSELVLDPMVTLDHIKHWIYGGVREVVETRVPLFGESLWGRIRWDRSLGVPKTARFADAFDFGQWYLAIKVIDTGGVPIVEKVWIEMPGPIVFDGPHDEQYYRVSFVAPIKPGLLNRVWVSIRPKVEWEPQYPRWSGNRRVLVTPDQMLPYGTFFVYEGDVIHLADYEVVRRF